MSGARDLWLRPGRHCARAIALAAIACGVATMGVSAQQEPESLMSRVGLIGILPDLTDQGFDDTGFNTDVAISGSGFLKVDLGNGAGYTRYGALFLDKKGVMGMCGGGRFYPLEPRLELPVGAGNIAVKIDGTVRYTNGGSDAREAAGRVLVWRFANPRGLKPRGDRIFVETDASGAAAADEPGHRGAGYLLVGYLERSDADPFRAFPANDGM